MRKQLLKPKIRRKELIDRLIKIMGLPENKRCGYLSKKQLTDLNIKLENLLSDKK